jgi:CheY-like chemotaxis protein
MVSVKPKPRSRAFTFLLVDDDPIIRNNGRELLEAMGFRVATAANSEEALKVFSRLRKVDLVILDYNLPGQNGLSVLKKLKSLEPGVRVLMASGYFPSQVISRIHESGAFGLIYKPYRVAALEPFILRLLKRDRPV